MPPADLEGIEKYLLETHTMKRINPRNIISYAMYPKVYDDYCYHWEYYTDVSKLTSDVFFYGQEMSLPSVRMLSLFRPFLDMKIAISPTTLEEGVTFTIPERHGARHRA